MYQLQISCRHSGLAAINNTLVTCSQIQHNCVLAASLRSYLATSCNFLLVVRSCFGDSPRSIGCLLVFCTFLFGTKDCNGCLTVTNNTMIGTSIYMDKGESESDCRVHEPSGDLYVQLSGECLARHSEQANELCYIVAVTTILMELCKGRLRWLVIAKVQMIFKGQSMTLLWVDTKFALCCDMVSPC